MEVQNGQVPRTPTLSRALRGCCPLGRGWTQRGQYVVPPTFAGWRAARTLEDSLPLRILTPVRVRWVPAHR